MIRCWCFVCFLFFLSSCDKKPQLIEYHQNKKKIELLIYELNTFFIDSTKNSSKISSFYSDDFLFHSFPVNFKKGVTTNKTDYINSFDSMKNNGMSLSIDHCIYLPGLDQKSFIIDGSVRLYYGATMCLDTNCAEFSGYQTINFLENKILAAWEWADYGGVQLELSN